jgi:hypothetical protein
MASSSCEDCLTLLAVAARLLSEDDPLARPDFGVVIRRCAAPIGARSGHVVTEV